MNIFAFIPARYDSTRFPGKPLAMIAGKPMIQHVHGCASSCPDVSEVFIATDDQRIFDCIEGFGGKAVLTDKSLPSGTDRIAEAAKKLSLAPDDLVINIQGDQPVFNPGSITSLIKPFREDPDNVMSTLKFPFKDEKDIENPNFVKVVTDKDGFALYFSRSPIPFYRDSKPHGSAFKHLGFYAYRMDFLRIFAGLPVGELESAEKLEQLRALENSYKIKVMESAFDSIEVDTPDDTKKVEEMMDRMNDE